MSDGLNRVILLGNVGSEPDLRYTAAGMPVLSFRLATNESFLDRNREVQQRTDWHNITVWGPRGEALARTLGKGTCLLVEGGLRTSSYEKDGLKRYKTEVHAKEICFAGRRAIQGQPEDDASARAPATLRDDMGGPGPLSIESEPFEGEPQPARPTRNGKASAMPPQGLLAAAEELPF